MMDDCVAQLTITGAHRSAPQTGSAPQPGVRDPQRDAYYRDNEIVTFHELRIQRGPWATCDFSRSNFNGAISDIIVRHIYYAHAARGRDLFRLESRGPTPISRTS